MKTKKPRSGRPGRGFVVTRAAACSRNPSAPTRNRTENLLIKSQLLYQLSYRRWGGETSSGETRYASYATPVTSTKPASHSAPIGLVVGGASRQAIGNVR